MNSARYWAVVPAAGIGTRMGADRPKQYLSLLGRTVLEHTLHKLLAVSAIEGIVVCVGKNDLYWPQLGLPARIFHVTGGAERSDSVRNGLAYLQSIGGKDDDWVLVHDAARPCVRPADIEHLIQVVKHHPVGGLLATPVRDTLKKADSQKNVVATVQRTHLWHALTPQMFRISTLHQALTHILTHRISVTDDAQAVECLGHAPLLVEGHSDNIKITHPQDLAQATRYLQAQDLNI